MPMSEQVSPVFDVRLSEDLEGVVLASRDTAHLYLLQRSLHQALPELRLRRSALGLLVRGFGARRLLDTELAFTLKWTEAARLYAENRRRIWESAEAVHGEVARVLASGRAYAQDRLEGMDGTEVLDDHQLVNVAAMTVEDGFGLCVFDEQGTGKTVTLIFAFDRLVGSDEADLLLIVAPKSMIGEWPRDIHRFLGDLYSVQVVSGTRNQKRQALMSGADILITNFETAVSLERELRALLRSRRGRAVLAVDESFFIKNPDAQRTLAIRRLREWCGRAFVLCGTPAPNAPQDLIEQFSLVDLGFTFEQIDVPEDRTQGRAVVQRAVGERGLFVRHLKDEVLPGLPQRRFNRLLVRLEPEQERLYRANLTHLVADLRATDEVTFTHQYVSFLARRNALLQICSHPGSISEGYSETPAKLLALDSLLDQLVEQGGEKVVLWSFYTRTIEELVVRYSRLGVVRYDGKVNDVSERRTAVRKFQEDDDTRLFVGNPAAAGAGLTLHRARYAVYESMSNQAAHYLQSLDRIHRRGQVRPVEYIMILCEGTIDEEEYDRLLSKESAAQELLGDPAQERFTRSAMLANLEHLQEWLDVKREEPAGMGIQPSVRS